MVYIDNGKIIFFLYNALLLLVLQKPSLVNFIRTQEAVLLLLYDVSF